MYIQYTYIYIYIYTYIHGCVYSYAVCVCAQRYNNFLQSATLHCVAAERKKREPQRCTTESLTMLTYL